MIFETIHGYLTAAAGYLWGWPMLILLVSTGVMLTSILRGLQFWMLIPALRQAFGPQGDKSHGAGMISNRAALFTALAATVGTGNIVGVATAIAMGGPGAMFWMWVSGLLGMALKYGETLLGVHYRVQTADGQYRGGPMYYLTAGVKSPWLGKLFALFLAFATLSIGGMVQSNSVADAMQSGFGFEPTIVGLVMVVAAAVIMFGGLKSIARVADVMVPTMIIAYALSGTVVILANMEFVPGVLRAIFADAFTGSAMAGGFVGSTLLMAMRFGLARGVFANESGLGSAAIVAATAKTRHPAEQGLISMTQTFIDTFFVCTFTGLVILVTGAWQSVDVASAGASLTNLAFNSGLGNMTLHGVEVGSAIVSICLTLFAFTTVLGWGYYGQQGAVYLFGPKVSNAYLWIFLGATFFGAAVLDIADTVKNGVQFIWMIADITTGLMMIPNLYALWMLSGTIKRLTFDYLHSTKTGKPFSIAPFANARTAAAHAPEALKAAVRVPMKAKAQMKKAVVKKAGPAKKMARRKARR